MDFDCDRYSSTITCWKFLLHFELIRLSITIIYDDWGAYKAKGCNEHEIGEAMAHLEISDLYDVCLLCKDSHRLGSFQRHSKNISSNKSHWFIIGF